MLLARGPRLRFNLLIIFLIIMGFGAESRLLARDINIEAEVKKYHPKLESVLGRLAEKYEQSRIAMYNFAQQRGIFVENDQVRVILVPPPGEEAAVIDKASLVHYGAVIEATSRHLVRIRVSVTRLEEIADEVKGVSYIRVPYKPFSDKVVEESESDFSNLEGDIIPPRASSKVISEGVALVGASDYHQLGYKGGGTRVAVIDIGFNNLTRSIARGEMPRNIFIRNYTDAQFESGRNHGTAVAEIVHDMAPEAQLYLIRIADEVDLENAGNYCRKHNIHIINHSWIWFNTNFTDGTGLICQIADEARADGILWVNAAGNFALTHYQGFFNDTRGDDWHEFHGGDETNTIQHGGGGLNVYLTWNSWPTTDQDYDLYVYDSTSHLVGFSTNRQTGTQEPTERVSFSHLDAGTYHIMIKKYSGTGDQELKLNANVLEYQSAEHSVVSPADATGAMAVGYIDIENWQTGPQGSRSSQGPSNDGRMKPDIMGPAKVSSFTWGIGNSTSTSTPHVSGAAALILSRYAVSTVDQLRSDMEGWAVDMGASGNDNIYGSGRLRLLAPPVLSWTGEANYESDGLNPERGNISTAFVYRIKYVDDNNYAPKGGYPKVYILKNGSEIAGSPFTMSEVDPADTTYVDGKLYTHTKTGLDAGTGYSYYFEAYDAYNGVLAIGHPVDEEFGPSIVLPGNLENLIVYPNPFSRGEGHGEISFRGLTSDARIRIFALTGELVKEEEVSWQYIWIWDVRNASGEELARGVYVWIVTNSVGERRIGKVAVK